jgi:glucoamylase
MAMPGDDPAAAAHDEASSLAGWIDRQVAKSAAAMLQSISAVHLVKERPAFGQIVKPASGSVLASPAIASYDPDPDYFFHWLRDSAVVIDAMGVLIAEGAYGSEAVGVVADFLRFSLGLCNLDGRALLERGDREAEVDPAFRQYLRPESELRAVFGDAVLGEARFNPDGTLDITKWGRPQHDGPAMRALTVLRLLRRGLLGNEETRGLARALVATDLAFVARHWAEPSFDIWEEERGHHYYTRLVQQAALADGAAWLEAIGDPDHARTCRAAAREIAERLEDHWSPGKGFYLSRLGVAGGSAAKELDIATILAVIHARRESGPHSVRDPKALATLRRLEALFAQDYPINAALAGDRGPAMGRYGGDLYYSGGAYYFATLGAAEFYFSLAGALGDDALMRKGDGFMATVRAHTPASGELSEQFDRATGRQTSAKNLAWSHAAFVTAADSRRKARRRMGQHH